MDKDRIEGNVKELGGKLTGDEELEREGKGQDALGKGKDAAREGWDAAKDAVDDVLGDDDGKDKDSR